jgi:hypothetical protein
VLIRLIRVIRVPLHQFTTIYCKYKNRFIFCYQTKTPHMKKSIIGAIVGALLHFYLANTFLDSSRSSPACAGLHPKQDTIMSFLNATLDKEGGYLMPTVPKGTSMEEATKVGEKMNGKPWASIQYHKSFNGNMNDMYMNMFRGFVATFVMVWLLCWILGKWARPSFFNIFLACLFTGLIVFINNLTTIISGTKYSMSAHTLSMPWPAGDCAGYGWDGG